MRAKVFAVVKEGIAAGRKNSLEAAGAAMCAEVYQIPRTPKTPEARNLTAEEAHRIVAMVSLGKKSILYRLGNMAQERRGAIDELSSMLLRRKPNGRPFAKALVRAIAGTALHELAFDVCASCKGSGVIRDHDLQALEGRQPMKVCPTCMGAKRFRFNEDQRTKRLAEEWRPDDAKAAAKELRASARLGAILAAVDTGRATLLEAERIAVEESGYMLGKSLAP